LLYTGCIYATGEAVWSGVWDEETKTYEKPVSFCTKDTPGYSVVFWALSGLPFVIRLAQCGGQLADAMTKRQYGSVEWRRHALNMAKYTTSLSVIGLSLGGDAVPYFVWAGVSCVSTFYCFAWDVLVDWGLGPQPVRRAVRVAMGEPMYKSSQKQNVGYAYWLRSVRALPDHWYVCGIGFDLFSRLTWAVYISPRQKVVQANATLLLGAIEIGRRTLWALFRLEWEEIRRKSVEVHKRFEHDDDKKEPLLGRGLGGRRSRSKEFLKKLSDRAGISVTFGGSNPRATESTPEQKIEEALQKNIARMDGVEGNLVVPEAGPTEKKKKKKPAPSSAQSEGWRSMHLP